MIEQALSRGVNRIGWHCWKSNTPSGATALKVGYQKITDYPVYFAWYDEAANLAVNGNSCFYRGEYLKALSWYERSFTTEKAPTWVSFMAACASAQLGKRAAAFEYLRGAVEGGFHDRAAFETSPYLATLRADPGWPDLIGLIPG
jgi:hypothetical protein